MENNLRTTLLGFVIAIVVLAVLFSLVGIGDIVDALSMAEPLVVAVLPLIALVWLVAWGLLLRVVVSVIDGQLSVVSSVLIYVAATFANNITPFGQAGGEPISAYFISNSTDVEYETGLAVIASVDAIHFVPSISLAAIGLASFAATTTLTEELQAAAAAVLALVIIIPVLGTLIWRFQTRVEECVARGVTPVVGIIARVVPNREPPDRESIITRIDGFFVAVGRVATDRRGLVFSFGLATIGWVALAGILWTSIFALGNSVPFSVVLLIIPIGSMASITPLPGGLGGIEIVLTGLLVSITGLSAATAGAAVLLHRAAAYWLPTICGGVIASFLGTGSG
jgi:uncharacterized protein (TIRG00374 family)